MGKLKKTKKSKTSKKSSVASFASSALSSVYNRATTKSSRGGTRRSRQTPEKLARQILILKLKRKLFRLKYGGR